MSCLSSVMSTMISFSGKLSQFHCSILWSDPGTPGLYTIPAALANSCLHKTQELSPHKRLLPKLSGTQDLPSFLFCHDPLLMKGLPAFLLALSYIVSFTCDCCFPFSWPWFVLKSPPWLISGTRKAGEGKCFCSNYYMHIVYLLAIILDYFFLLKNTTWRDGKKPFFSSLEAKSLFFHKNSYAVKKDQIGSLSASRKTQSLLYIYRLINTHTHAHIHTHIHFFQHVFFRLLS